MRLLVSIVMIALLFAIVVFAATNLGTTVPVRILNRVYEQVHIAYVVVVSVLAGALIVGVFSVFEGAKIRLENHRLRREVGRLESQLTFLRTQPSASERIEPDDPGPVAQPDAVLPAPTEAGASTEASEVARFPGRPRDG